MLKTEEIQAFIQIVDSGTITAAAEQLRVAKSAISRRLSELEEQLGVELFHRSTRKLNLTDSGHLFYQRCTLIIDEIREAEFSVSQSHKEISGQLKIAVPHSFGVMHLASAIVDFQKQHPAIFFDIDLNDREVDLIQEGFDIAIRIGTLKDSSLIARKLAELSTVVCASPKYLDKNGKPVTVEELKQHNCIAYSYLEHPDQWDFFDKNNKLYKVKINKIMQINNGEFMRDMAISGLGIIRQPTFIAYEDIVSGNLIPFLHDYRSTPLNLYALYPPTRHLSQKVRLFIDFLVERYTGKPYWEHCLIEK